MCENKFSKLAVGNQAIRHCKRCAKAICQICSDQKRQLSLDDKEKYRVCDECDVEMDNQKLKVQFDKLCDKQSKLINRMEEKITELDDTKGEQENDF